MDNNLERVRAALQSMPRRDALALADLAGVARSTAQKIRRGHIKDPGASKIEALAKAITLREQAEV